MKILILEDNEGLALLISEVVQDCGYKSHCITNGNEATKWLLENSPFFIIMDYSLPDMTAKQLVTQFKEMKIPLPPFMISTGQGDEKTAVEMMKLGAIDYIIKDRHFFEVLPLSIHRIAREIENERQKLIAQEKLLESERRFQKLFNTMNEGVILFDENTQILEANTAVQTIFGKNKSEIIGKKISELSLNVINLDSESNTLYTCPLLLVIREKKQINNYIIGLRRDNSGFSWLNVNTSPLTDETGTYIATFMDITQREEQLKKLQELSTTDQLTELHNRRYILETTKNIQNSSRRENKTFSIAMLDIDHFKKLNDKYGHLAGDEVLKKFSQTIRENLRSYDIAGRFGGEEFIIILPNTAKEEAAEILARILSTIRKTTICYKNSKIMMTFTCGIAESSEIENKEDTEQLIELADIRLYKGKSLGRDNIQLI
ncbi:MAG: diguanylate cyclase [Spirochaetales bacterium]|nr:diguanylate cyclase [Spirochaetales bacterium]